MKNESNELTEENHYQILWDTYDDLTILESEVLMITRLISGVEHIAIKHNCKRGLKPALSNSVCKVPTKLEI